MRLINADECIEKIKSMPVTYDAETVQRCIEVLSNAPTVDAVPVIRCKDCKYYPYAVRPFHDNDIYAYTFTHCKQLGPDGFCSLAKV